jgi:chemotaxis protein MotB
MRKPVVFVLFLSLAGGSGCVSSGTHEALQADFDKSQKALADEEEKSKSLEEALAAEEKKSAQLQAHADQIKANLKKAMDELTATNEKMASAMKDKTKMSESIAEMKTAMAELKKRKAEADKRIAEFKDLLSKFKSLIDAGKLKVKITDGRMVVALATDVLFGSGSARLSKDGKAAITEVTQVLTTIPGRSFQVEGHTDNVPIKTAKYASNWELAAARSLTVVKTMIDSGMAPERVSAASFGDTKPAASNQSDEGKAANRRIEIVVVPDLSTLPGFDELKKVSQ